MWRIAVVLVLVLAAAIWPATSAQASGSATTAAAGLQADFNNDGFADLAVAASYEHVGTIPDAGGVHVLYGTPTGLAAAGSQLFTQDSPGVGDGAEGFDAFGEVLAAGDFDNDGRADLAVGVSRQDIGSLSDAGSVNVLPGSAGGLTGTGSQLFTQDSPGMPDMAEDNELFAETLAASGP